MIERTLKRRAVVHLVALGLVIASSAVMAAAGVGAEGVGGFRVGFASDCFPTVFAAVEETRVAGGSVIALHAGQMLAADQPGVVVAPGLSAGHARQLKAKLAAAGVQVAAMRAQLGTNTESAERICRLATNLGVSVIIAELAPDAAPWQPKPSDPPPDWKAGALDRLGWLSEKYDLDLAIVNPPRDDTRPDFRLWEPRFLMSLITNRSARLNVCGDVGNLLRSGVPPLEGLRLLAPRMVSCRLGDRDAAGPQGRAVTLGDGVADARGVLVELKRQGFSGPLFIECPSASGNVAVNLSPSVDFVRREGAKAAAAGLLAAEKEVTVIDGFKYEILDPAGISEPMDLEFSPDGRLWVTGRRGELWVMWPETRRKALAGKLTVDFTDDRGLHGIEFHPGFATNGWVYLFFAPVFADGVGNRLSRFTISGQGRGHELLTNSEVVLLEFRADKVGQHNGGAVEFNPRDGKLYVSTGDNNNIPDLEKYFDDPHNKAQSLNDLRGKVLRLNLDGSVPADNPFVNQPGRRGEIFTSGHRQPFTLRVDAVTGRVFEGENGGDRTNDFEEVNLLLPGGNYGWPRGIGDNLGTFGGANPIPGALKPWLAYQRFTGGSCIVGPFYRANGGRFAFPANYHDGLFYADYNRHWLRFAHEDPHTKSVKSEPFARGFAGGPLAVELGPDGALYLVEYGGWMRGSSRDRVSRIIYSR